MSYDQLLRALSGLPRQQQPGQSYMPASDFGGGMEGMFAPSPLPPDTGIEPVDFGQGAPPGLAMPSPEEMPQPSGAGDYGYGGPQGDLRAGLLASLAGQKAMPWGAPVSQEAQGRANAVRSAYEPGPAQQRYLEALTNQPANVHGFKAHLLGALKGLAMGNIGGGILGAFDPSMVERAWHRVQAQSLAEPAQAEAQMQQARLKGASEIGNLTGVDPITGLPTAAASYKEAAIAQKQQDLDRREVALNQQIQQQGVTAELRQRAFELSQEKTALAQELAQQRFQEQMRQFEARQAELERSHKVNEGSRAAGQAETQRYHQAMQGQGERRLSQSENAAIEKNVPHDKKALEAASKDTNIFGRALPPEQIEANKAKRAQMEAENEAYRQQARQKVQTQGASSGVVQDPNIGRTVNGGRNVIVGIKNGKYVFNPPLE